MTFEFTRENNFDAMRFIAAVLVLYSHCFPLAGLNYEPLAKYTGFGTFGGLAVGTFFIISGFLITASYERSKSLKQYIKNRALRIVPAYAVVILLGAFILGPIVTTLTLNDYFLHPQTYSYLRGITFYGVEYILPGVFEDHPRKAMNGSLWTIPMEVTMYIVIAALGLMSLLRYRIFMVAFALALFVGYIMLREMDVSDISFIAHPQAYQHYLKNGYYFMTGAIYYLWRNKIPNDYRIFLVCILALLIVAKTPYAKYVFNIVLPYMVLYVGLLKTKHIKNFGKYGDFSYGFYLYAYPMQQLYIYFVGVEDITILTFFIAASLMTMPCAIASWHLIEKPALNLKNYSIRRAGKYSVQ